MAQEDLAFVLAQASACDCYNNKIEYFTLRPGKIKDQEMVDKILDYIYLNPVVAGFVLQPEDWNYSSARDFYFKKGLVELISALNCSSTSGRSMSFS